MTSVFPRSREDGSFSIVACFAVGDPNNEEALSADVAAWLEDWITRFATSSCTVETSGSVSTEQSHFLDHFVSFPVVIQGKEGELWIRFDGFLDSPEWKVWFVRIVTALTRSDLPVGKLICCVDYDNDI